MTGFFDKKSFIELRYYLIHTTCSNIQS